MSVPAQNTSAVPVRTATHSPGSSWNPLRAASMPCAVGPSIALRFSGRSIRTTRTRPCRSVVTVIESLPRRTGPDGAGRGRTGPDGSVPADLDQILVRVADVDTADRSEGPGAVDRALLDRDALGREALDHRLQRVVGDEAQVGAPRGRVEGLGLELLPGLMKVDLVAAEGERPAPTA